MFKIDVDKILPVTDARASISTVVDEVLKGNTYVLTRGGRPVVAIIPTTMLKDVRGIGKPATVAEDEKIEITTKNNPQDSATSNLQQASPAISVDRNQDLPHWDMDKINQAVNEYEKNTSAKQI